MEKLTFHIVTPYWGPEKFLQECVHSVKMQTVSSIHHVIIDTDRKGACRNHFEALKNIDPDQNNIIVHLDGDDKFITHKALEIISKEYENRNVWATYGNYVSREKSVCRNLPQNTFRESIVDGGWGWSHPRTFRASLIPYLNESSMKDSRGNWFSSASDVAIFLPILEMAGKDRVKFIDEDLVYYRIHPNNDHSNREKLQDQVRCALELYRMPEYSRLFSLSEG